MSTMFHFSAKRRALRFSSQLRSLLQELVDQEPVPLFADHVEIPHGMIENHQHVGFVVKGPENLREAIAARVGGKFRERRHPLLRAGAGQVVNAEVERLRAIRSAPLHGNGNMAGAGHGAQQHGRVDVVVVADRHHRRQTEHFNLPAFQVEGQFGSHRRRPIAGCIIHAYPVNLLCAALQTRQQWAHHRILIAEVGQKVQRFLRLVGVAVQRDASPETPGRIFVAPEIRDGRIGHGCSFIRDQETAMVPGFLCIVSTESHKLKVNIPRIPLQL
jgi:hypothetical protein